ncbi:hotdog fold domain-containing protein [Halomonas sp. SpR1]|uniref:hotdog fold domain-containing protein n=1 Tax=Halomonas sp. SpR1 TaxID=3050462 RepID=UPI0027E48B3A|nr:hotdog fold domain-containing protein [Halomonas sp. SpR1]MDQ7732585.1 hotdog fold domain-containing protein [Halomonas sp. SpR1]
MQKNKVLRLWERFSTTPLRRWLFSRIVCFRAPYFGSIMPLFVSMQPGEVVIQMRKRRRVKNHIGTVHAIAMCNLAELAAGTMMEVSIPGSHRWIPKNMSVEYLSKAETDVRAIATLSPLPEFGSDSSEIQVPVAILNHHGETVMKASIGMWVSPRKQG